VGDPAGGIHDAVLEVIHGVDGRADFFQDSVPTVVGDDFLRQELEPFRIADPVVFKNSISLIRWL
jgi:hypothetical protein